MVEWRGAEPVRDRSTPTATALTTRPVPPIAGRIGAWAAWLARVAELGLLALAFGLRVWGLGWRSFWFDEGYTAWLVRGDLADLVQTTAEDIHPPLYYLVIRFWNIVTEPSNEFSIRLISALAGTLTVALVMRLAADMFGRRARLLAGLLAAVSPFLILYSQEARMYSLLVTLEALAVWCLWRGAGRGGVGWWYGWGLATVFALYTHYFAAFALVAQLPVLVVAITLGPARLRAAQGAVAALAVIALLYLPWAFIAFRQLSGYGSDWVPPPTLSRMVNETVRAFATGDVAAGGWDWLVAAGAGAALLALAALVRRPSGAMLALLWLTLPVGAVFAASLDRPMFHVRYLMLALPALYLLLGGGLTLLRPWFGAGLAILAAPLLVLHLGGLATVEATPKDEARQTYQAIAASLGPNDVVIYDAKHPFAYYAAGDPRWVNPFTSGLPLPLELEGLLYGRREAWLVHWTASTADAQDYLPWYLDGQHRLIEQRSFRGYELRRYAVDATRLGRRPGWTTLAAPFEGGLTLTGWQALPAGPRQGVTARAGEGASIALRWLRASGPTPDLSAFVVALDPAGRAVTKADVELLDPAHLATARWEAGEQLTYHRLPVPVGVPPGEYQLRLGLYETATQRRESLLDGGRPIAPDFALGPLTVERGEPGRRPVVATAVDQPAGQGITLAGYDLSDRRVTPGQPIATRLCWTADAAPPADLVVRLALSGPGLAQPAVSSGAAAAGYPMTGWAAGEAVCGWRELRVPSRTPAGRYALTAALEPGGAALALGEIEVRPRERPAAPAQVGRPVNARFENGIELVGYDLSAPLAPGAAPVLTLYWRTDDDVPAAYTAFVQFMGADGTMVAQDDAPPGGAAHPTTTWLPDELVAGTHTLTVPAGANGHATLNVGLYDPLTLKRLSLVAGGDTVTLLDVDLGR